MRATTKSTFITNRCHAVIGSAVVSVAVLERLVVPRASMAVVGSIRSTASGGFRVTRNG